MNPGVLWRRWALSAWLGIVGSAWAEAPAPDEKPLSEALPRVAPKEPAEALKTFAVRDGFRLDLLAAEPLVADPVAGAFDENGRLYVVEMRGYPFPEKMGAEPTGRIVALEDSDGDGVFDKSTTFVDKLSWPTGVLCWKGGVFVTVAPDIRYYKDTNGDGKADVAKTVFTGFGKDNVQALLNNLQWGLDNKIHGATAGNGGAIRPGDQPNAEPIAVRGRDFRFDPETNVFEAISGTAQFGACFDDWGHRFVCSNSNHAQEVVLPAAGLSRNPFISAPEVIASIAKEGGAAPVFRASPAEPWRLVRTRRRALSGKAYPPTELVPIGFFTSASGITVYRGDAYPEKYRGNLFIGDVGGNLIHRKTLSKNGACFLATRADNDVEWITSTDNWFRPVNFVNAPDGTLLVLDMYREVIEHPWSIPDDIKAHLDLQSGKDRGRIYRLTPPDFHVPPPARLGDATTEQLVAMLESSNGWRRDTAHRLIHERRDSKAIEPLRILLRESGAPVGRLHALWSLDGLDALSDDDLLLGLKDSAPGVRENAVELAQRRLSKTPALRELVLQMVDDPEPMVRFQVAFALGEIDATDAAQGLARLLASDGDDRWTRAAVLSSSANVADRILAILLSDPELGKKPVGEDALAQLAFIVGARNRSEEIARLLASIQPEVAAGVRPRILAGLGDGLSRAGARLSDLENAGSPETKELLQALFGRAKSVATDPDADVPARRQAIQLLGYQSWASAGMALVELLDARQPPPVQLAAIEALRGFAGSDAARAILERWAGLTPPVRSEAIEAIVARKEGIASLLNAIADGEFSAGQIDAKRRDFLLKHPDRALRERAAKLLGANAPGSRETVLKSYDAALAMTGDLERGKKVFLRECSVCHKVSNEGHAVGPDLATVRNRAPGSLLTQILDPNREVAPDYVNYVISLDDGRVVTGIIASESATGITLKREREATDVLLRANIEAIQSSGKSLMPEGLEQKVTVAEMADLIAFLLQLPQK